MKRSLEGDDIVRCFIIIIFNLQVVNSTLSRKQDLTYLIELKFKIVHVVMINRECKCGQ